MKILVYAPQDTFIRPITDRLTEHEIKLSRGAETKQELWRDLEWADLVWVEWCTEQLVEVTAAPYNKPIICRLHSYEVFTEVPRRVKWSKVSCLLFVASHIHDVFCDRFPEIDVRKEVILNGVDLETFTIPGDKPITKNLAYLGYINYKKNPGLLMQCFKEIHERDPEFKFFVGGVHQDPRIQVYMDDFIEKNKLPVTYDGWIDDVQGWLRDKQYAVSTSYIESFCYGVAEPMACGVVPLIHAWPGAIRLYPPKYLFTTPAGCWKLIERAEKNLADERIYCRSWIRNNFDIEDRIQEVSELISDVVEGTKGDGRVTLTMIVRDEAKGIAKAMDSVKDLVDEMLVFVDNETADETAEIARAKGARVHIYEWEDDFAAARNRCQDEADTEWALVLDGHEYMQGNVKGLREIIDSHPQVDAFDLLIVTEGGDPHRHGRLYRRSRTRWDYPVHNIVVTDGPVGRFDDVQVVHDRYHGQSKEARERRNRQRDEMVVRILSKRIIEHPNDTRSMFYLAQQHKDALRWEAALYWYERYVKVRGGNQWDEEMYTALYQGGRAALYLRDPERARDFGYTATTIPGFMNRAEAWDVIGEVAYTQGSYQQALEIFEKAAICPTPTSARLWYDRALHGGGWLIMCKIASCHARLGRDQEALDIYEELIEKKLLPPEEAPRVLDNIRTHRVNLGLDDFDVPTYWNMRYHMGGTSGAGSRGRLLDFKISFVNGFIYDHKIDSVMDFGCGDGEFASKLKCRVYTGVDVSEEACKKCFDATADSGFDECHILPSEDLPKEAKADLCLSLDVIFHLVDDAVYEAYMHQLFEKSQKYVMIYSSDQEDDGSSPPHIKHHVFTEWIAQNEPKWELRTKLTNPHPYDPNNPQNTSLSDFYVYEKVRGLGPSPDEK